MNWSRPISVWLAPALVLALGVAVILWDGLGIESALSNSLFDAYQRHLPYKPDAPRAVPLDLPALDEDTLVAVTRALAKSGAAAVAFAAPLEPGPSPQGLAARLPPGKDNDAARAALARLPEPGHDLAAALQAIPGVVPVTLGPQGPVPHIKAKFTYRGGHDPFGKVPAFTAAAAGPALLEDNAAGVAARNLTPDADGVVRRMPLAFALQSSLVPGLAAEAMRVVEGKPAITVTTNERDPLSFLSGVGIAGMESAGHLIPADADGGLRLRFGPPLAARLDMRQLDSASLKGAIVIVGPPWTTTIRTPLGPDSVAGVMAQAVQDILDGAVLARPAWMPAAEACILGLLGLAMIVLLRFGLGWAAGLVMVSAALLGLISWYCFEAHGLLLDAATPALGLALAYGAGAAAHIHDMRLAYAGLRMAFSDSLPRATIEKIARRPSLLKIEGETRNVTYLVCGVRGLAGLSASYKDDPVGFTRLLQKALTPMIDQALAHGGTIDRLTADGFAAFWNAPLEDGDHALHACEAANGMAIMSSRVTEQLALEQRDADAPPLVEIGVGVATGPVIAGGFGGYGRMGYSVNGDVVALAGRIQALSHQYGPALIVSDETRRAAERGFAFLEVDTIAAGAKGPPTMLWAIMGNSVSRATPKFRAMAVFHDHIFQAIRKQQWAAARELIAQCRRLSGASQKLYDVQLARIAWYEKNPPGENWDGAFRPILE